MRWYVLSILPVTIPTEAGDEVVCSLYFTSNAPNIPGSRGGEDWWDGWNVVSFEGRLICFPYMASLDAFLTFHEDEVQA